jgi:hypothetical protein
MGTCHVNTIFHLTVHSPKSYSGFLASLCETCMEVFRNICGKYRRIALRAPSAEGFSGKGPSKLNAATCWAASRIPQMEKVREAYQKPGAVQWADATVFQEKDAVMTAVIVTHWGNVKVGFKIWGLGTVRLLEGCDSRRWK